MNTGTKSEQIRAAVIALTNAALPFLVLVDVIDWNAETIAACMIVITTLVTLIFLLIPNKVEPVPVAPAIPAPAPGE